VLDMSDLDFREMVAGKADAQKLYFGGKLKIGGDVMASQKLMFLKKIDPKRAADVVKNARGAGKSEAAGAGATVSAASASKAPKAPAILKALGERLEKTPGLAKDVGAIVQLFVTGPDAAYVLDLKNGNGSVKEGKGASDVQLKLTDDDLEALAKGASFRDLFQRGRVRVDGDMRIASKLNFFKGLV
jgi:3-hydroxyacyl-CoA dehydrogenase/3a,7a,12a-trihydroxy-5b-cholest-24-enoyl-CoA hydratase